MIPIHCTSPPMGPARARHWAQRRALLRDSHGTSPPMGPHGSGPATSPPMGPAWARMARARPWARLPSYEPATGPTLAWARPWAQRAHEPAHGPDTGPDTGPAWHEPAACHGPAHGPSTSPPRAQIPRDHEPESGPDSGPDSATTSPKLGPPRARHWARNWARFRRFRSGNSAAPNGDSDHDSRPVFGCFPHSRHDHWRGIARRMGRGAGWHWHHDVRHGGPDGGARQGPRSGGPVEA